jgi:transposase
MPKVKTPSFICELPLSVTPADERKLLIRLDCARQVYNACLGEALKRLRLLRASPEYQAARQLACGSQKRTAAFREANVQAGFREYDLHAYATQFSHSWLGAHLDSNTVQKVASRAFHAAKQYAFGKRGKPRFKGKGGFDSVEGKTNASGIVWREDTVRWLGLELPAILPSKDEVIAHGLGSRVKFVRLLRRKLNGRNRFYAQLICAGKPFHKAKHAIGRGVIGLDLGPSTLATVSADGRIARLERFCAELVPRSRVMRKLQRKLERQRRANNPENYNEDGTSKKGKHTWKHSQRYLQTRACLAEEQRRLAAQRQSLHGRKVNETLAQGDGIKMEKLSYRAFQRQYGRSVGFRAPGKFVRLLRRKAENAGVRVDEFPTRTTCLSQVCLCGAKEKKPLSRRWHVCDCGVGPIQRDLFSAWLACFVEGNQLDAGQAQAAWPGVDPGSTGVDTRLRTASSEIEPVMGQGNPSNLARGQNRSSVQSGSNVSEAGQGACSAVVRELVVLPEPPRIHAWGVIRPIPFSGCG